MTMHGHVDIWLLLRAPSGERLFLSTQAFPAGQVIMAKTRVNVRLASCNDTIDCRYSGKDLHSHIDCAFLKSATSFEEDEPVPERSELMVLYISKQLFASPTRGLSGALDCFLSLQTVHLLGYPISILASGCYRPSFGTRKRSSPGHSFQLHVLAATEL